MSKQNRKLTYDKLCAKGEFHKLSEPLKAEFGNPMMKKEEPKSEPKPAPKKEMKKESKKEEKK